MRRLGAKSLTIKEHERTTLESTFAFASTHLAIVVGGLDHLGRHPVGRADKGVALAHGVGELRCNAKIGKFDVAVVCEKNVAALDVTVHLAIRQWRRRGRGEGRRNRCGALRQRGDARGKGGENELASAPARRWLCLGVDSGLARLIGSRLHDCATDRSRGQHERSAWSIACARGIDVGATRSPLPSLLGETLRKSSRRRRAAFLLIDAPTFCIPCRSNEDTPARKASLGRRS